MIVIESIDHIGISVSNLEKSIEFYKELFDFEVIEKISSSKQAYIKVGEIVIGLFEVDGYKNQKNTKNHVSFYVDEQDFEDAFEEIKDMEIPIVFGPENIRNGKSLVFLDPDENQIEICYPRMQP
ncbi:MAG: VOC family protein [Spirochaetes bacterium]|nr:MAG: VOC family protein [Spirochaetota bacterium]